MNFNVLRLRLLRDEEVREENGYGQKNDNDNHALLQPTLRLAHPFNAVKLFLLGTLGGSMRVMVRHVEVKSKG